MEISKKLNIYKKEVGDKFYAEEVNQMVDAINDNYNQIEILKNKSIFNVDHINTTSATVIGDIQIDKFISNTIGDTFTLKGNGVVADYTLLTDQDLGDYAKKNDTNQIIKASSVEVNDGGVKFYTTRDSLNSTVSFLIGDFDQDRMPYLDFQGDEGNPRLTNIADPINAADAATKWYVDENRIRNFKLLATVETGTEATTEKKFKLLQSCGGYKKIIIYMERKGTTLSNQNIYVNIGGKSLMLVNTLASAKRCLFEIDLDNTLSIGKYYYNNFTESYITSFSTLNATAINTNMNTYGTLVFDYYASSVEPNVKFTIYGR